MATIERTRQVSATIDVTSSKIAEECYQERTFISIINTSTGGQIISLGIDQEAKALTGIVLYPGGVYAESKDAQNKATQAQFNAISSGAGGTLAITERIKMEERT